LNHSAKVTTDLTNHISLQTPIGLL